jgi:flavin-binding protein dodecin
MTHIAKVIEIIGSSDKGWEDAAQVAVNEARKTLHGIHGIEIMDMTATVDESTGKIIYYRASVKVAFGVEH